MEFIVAITDQPAAPWYLRRTTWTSQIDRADRYPSEEAARGGLAAARKFMKAASYKAARIVPAPSQGGEG